MEISELTQEQRDGLSRIIAIVGPTAVGKTSLSIALAKALGAEIVNLDSVQVYRQLDIGSAKPTLEERDGVLHHMIDVLDPDEEHNVGDFCRRAADIITGLHERGTPTIVVGGTGLYLRALIHGLLQAPAPDHDLRARHKADADRLGVPAIHARLAQVDPELAARIHVNDLVRISRGLEIFAQTGRKLSEMQREHQFRAPRYHALKLALVRPRPALYERVERRVDQMMSQGFLAECQALLSRYPRETKSLGSLGYRQMQAHVLDGAPLESAIEAIKRQTRRYAKQQLGWLRSEPDVRFALAPLVEDDGQVAHHVLQDIEGFLAGQVPSMSWAAADPYM